MKFQIRIECEFILVLPHAFNNNHTTIALIHCSISCRNASSSFIKINRQIKKSLYLWCSNCTSKWKIWRKISILILKAPFPYMNWSSSCRYISKISSQSHQDKSQKKIDYLKFNTKRLPQKQDNRKRRLFGYKKSKYNNNKWMN